MSLREKPSLINDSLTLGELEDRVEKLEVKARISAGQRFNSVGMAIGKIGIGGLLAVDAIHPVVHIWSKTDGTDLVGLAVGAAIVAWGFKDAGHVSYDVVHTRNLNNQVTTLRSALTRRYEKQVINRLPESEFTQ